MIHLESENGIIREALDKRFNAEKPESIETSGADFDGTLFKVISDKDNKDIVYVGMKVNGIAELSKYGMTEHLKKQYGDLLMAKPIDGMDVSLKLDLSNLDEDKKKKYLETVPLLKRYMMIGPFIHVFDKFKKGEKFDPIRIPYRTDENIYIVSYEKAMVIIYSIHFVDADDVIMAKTFLQELKDAKKDRTLGNAPAVNFTQGTKPLELRDTKSSEPDDPAQLRDWGFISMSLFERHIEEKNRENVIDRLISFRSYLHYHLKCTKAYMHIRMRDRVTKLLQNLEAAKDLSGKKVEKRTASGRTFTRTSK